MIEGWIRAKAGIDDADEIRQVLLRTLGELHPELSMDELVDASEQVAKEKETTGFKRDAEFGLWIAGNHVKAMLKESTNILYAGDRWGKTQKGPKSFLAERIFIAPERLYVGRLEPDGVETVIGHVSDKNGQRSTLGYHQYVEKAHLTFDVLSTRDAIEEDWWVDIWTHAEENGLGALRSQGYGKFDLIAWDKIDETAAAPTAVRVNGTTKARAKVTR